MEILYRKSINMELMKNNFMICYYKQIIVIEQIKLRIVYFYNNLYNNTNNNSKYTINYFIKKDNNF